MSESVALFDPGSGSFATITNGVLSTSAVVTSATIASSAVTSVASSATSVTLLAQNANRLGAVISNDSTAAMYLKFGATASATSHTYKLAAGDTLTIDSLLLYKGGIDAVWASANGFAYITELA